MNESNMGKWFNLLGEPMQVVDECTTALGVRYVWLTGPRHIYTRQRPEVHPASALVSPATTEQVRESAERYAETLRVEKSTLDLLRMAIAL